MQENQKSMDGLTGLKLKSEVKKFLILLSWSTTTLHRFLCFILCPEYTWPQCSLRCRKVLGCVCALVLWAFCLLQWQTHS